MKPRCILLERVRQDVSTVQQHGEIVLLFDGTTFRHSLFDASGDSEADILAALVAIEFDPVRDRVILAGSVIMQIRATAVIMARFGSFTACVFDTTTKEYVLLPIGNKVTNERDNSKGLPGTQRVSSALSRSVERTS